MTETSIEKIIAQRYRTQDLLGSGGMGTVYRALDERMQREVAVKIVKPAADASSKHLRRMSAEATALAGLSHPNIVSVHAAGFDETTGGYLVMELICGETVEQIVQRDGPMTALRVTNLAIQAADALQSAHNAGVIHRDLKPQNLMVVKDTSGSEQLKIMDFGIAKLIGVEDQRLTKTGEIIGSPRYMSPEQCGIGSATVCSDIYSLGCVMYFMLTGKAPFDADSMVEIALKHTTEPPDTSAIHDQRLRAIIGKCMEKSPAARFQTAEELSSALQGQAPVTRSQHSRQLANHKSKAIPPLVAGSVLAAGAIAALLLVNPSTIQIPLQPNIVMQYEAIKDRYYEKLQPNLPDYKWLSEHRDYFHARKDKTAEFEHLCYRMAGNMDSTKAAAFNHLEATLQARREQGTFSMPEAQWYIHDLALRERKQEAHKFISQECQRLLKLDLTGRARALSFERAQLLSDQEKNGFVSLQKELGPDMAANQQLMDDLKDEAQNRRESRIDDAISAAHTACSFGRLFDQPGPYHDRMRPLVAQAWLVTAKDYLKRNEDKLAASTAQFALDAANQVMIHSAQYTERDCVQSFGVHAQAQSLLAQIESKTKP